MYNLFLYSLEQTAPIHLINIEVLQNPDQRYVLDIIARKIQEVTISNVEDVITSYLKEKDIDHEFSFPVRECIKPLLEKGFLAEFQTNGVVKFQPTEKTLIIKSKPIED